MLGSTEQCGMQGSQFAVTSIFFFAITRNLILGDGNTTGDIYIWNGNVFERYQTLEVPPILSMVVFQHGSLSCIVYVELNFCEVYCSNGRGLEFELLERLPTRRGIKVSNSLYLY